MGLGYDEDRSVSKFCESLIWIRVHVGVEPGPPGVEETTVPTSSLQFKFLELDTLATHDPKPHIGDWGFPANCN